jgi:hypothetical protein
VGRHGVPLWTKTEFDSVHGFAPGLEQDLIQVAASFQEPGSASESGTTLLLIMSLRALAIRAIELVYLGHNLPVRLVLEQDKHLQAAGGRGRGTKRG